MQAPGFVPLGTICTVQGSDRKMMVIARGVAFSEDGGEQECYDYGACLYPEGLVGDIMLYFNHDDISKIVFRGFSDDRDKEMLKGLGDDTARDVVGGDGHGKPGTGQAEGG
jgi:hypothetical protein